MIASYFFRTEKDNRKELIVFRVLSIVMSNFQKPFSKSIHQTRFNGYFVYKKKKTKNNLKSEIKIVSPNKFLPLILFRKSD